MYRNGAVGIQVNINRTTNYLAKSAYVADCYFNGRIYNLKIMQADGEVVLHYDINKMLNKKKTNIEIASTDDFNKFLEEASQGRTFFGRTIVLKNVCNFMKKIIFILKVLSYF